MLVVTSCASTTKTVVVHEVPDVTFPIFPDPEPCVFSPGTVTMPLWYFEKITNYKEDVDAIQKTFEELRKLNENPK